MARERNYAIDYVKGWAILFVLLIHANAKYIGTLDHPFDSFLIMDTFGRFSVPFFFGVSGYWIGSRTSKDPRNPAYYAKYWWRIVTLLISWVLLYYLYDAAVTILYGHANELTSMTKGYLNIRTPYYGAQGTGYQLWYLFAVVWSIPALYLFARWSRVGWLLLIGLLLNLVGLLGQSYYVVASFPLSVTRDALFYGLFYLTLGYWLAGQYPKLMIKWRRIPAWAYLALFFLFSAEVIAEQLLLFKPYQSQSIGNYFISSIPMAACLLMFVLANPRFGERSLFGRIGRHAEGIFLIHLFFLDLAQRLIGHLNDESVYRNFFWNLLSAPVLLVVSYVGYKGLQLLKHKIGTYLVFEKGRRHENV